MLHKKKLLSFVILASLLSSCGSIIPAFPEVWQCAVDGTPRAFYCVNSRTGARKKLPIDSPQMKGAQALSLKDYKRSEQWLSDVKKIAEERCQ